MNVVLLYGGKSSEHEISCLSASFLETSLNQLGHKVFPVYVSRDGIWHLQRAVADQDHFRSNPCVVLPGGDLSSGGETIARVDFLFPIIHGTFGEDGTIQGFCETFGLAYAGCGVLSSALCMDKKFMRQAFAAAGLPQVRYTVFSTAEWNSHREQCLKKISALKYPLFSKPCNMGSSVGVHKIRDKSQLEAAIDDSFRFDFSVMVEEGVPAREIELSVAGRGADCRVSIAGEIIPRHEFYSYEAKYLDDNGADLKIPAEITAEETRHFQDLARRAFEAVGGEGFARVDFFLDRETGAIYLNEINTLPGFTRISMFPKLFEAAGVPAAEVISEIITAGIERRARSAGLNRLRL